MNIKELKEKLQAINPNWDEEDNHVLADKLLLEYIWNQEITDAFNSIKKWYA